MIGLKLSWFLSTPKGLNYFHDLYQRGIDATAPDWRSWQMPSSVNPFLPAAEVEAARADLHALTFQQDYEAQFLTSDGAVFRNVDACLHDDPGAPSEHARHIVVAGVDWGRQDDFTACSVVCVQCSRELALDRFNQVNWAIQRDRLLALFDKWGVRYAVVETNSIGGPNLEALRQYADGQLVQILIGEAVQHLTMVGNLMDPVVKGGDATILLAPVLQQVDTLVNFRRAWPASIQAENAAIILKNIHKSYSLYFFLRQ